MMASPTIQRGLERAGFTAPPPDRLEAKPLGTGRVELSWQDESAYETGFRVESSTNNMDFTLAADVGAHTTRVSLRASPGESRFFRVRSLSAAGVSGYRETVALRPTSVAILKPRSDLVKP